MKEESKALYYAIGWLGGRYFVSESIDEKNTIAELFAFINENHKIDSVIIKEVIKSHYGSDTI